MIDDFDYSMDPQGRTRFFGLYTANVLDNADPLKKGRLKLQIFQPTGKASSIWAPQCVGVLSQPTSPYGNFSSMTTQSVGVGSNTVVTFDSTDDKNGGVYLDSTKIYVSEIGRYKITLSASFKKSDLKTGYVDVWLRKNGVDVPKSGRRGILCGEPTYVVSTELGSDYSGYTHTHTLTINPAEPDPVAIVPITKVIDLQPKDYIEVVMSASKSNTTLQAYTSPSIPSIIASVNLVGNYLPKPGTKVWVMFEAGDPEYPVWMGGVV